MRDILVDEVGILAWFVTLDPSAKELLVNIFVAEKGEGVEVSAGLRLRNKRAASTRIRRMEPPPTAVRMGLKKFWTAFEQELGLLVEKGTTLGSERVTSRSDRKPMSQPRDDIPLVKQFIENLDAVAVVIGNKNYANRVPTVDFAHNDAEAMKQFFVAILGVRQSNVIDMRDVTLAEMEAVFGNDRTHKGQLWRWIRPGESDVFVFYSGHGVPGSNDGRQYLLPVDGDPDAPEIHGYPTELLYRNLSNLKGRSVTVFMDTCFSGESPRGPLLRKSSGIRVIPKETSSVPFIVLSASSKDQLASWDNEAKQGLFTKHLLEALYGAADDKRYGNSDGQITLSEIKGYLDREMTYAARRHYGRDQQATVIGDPEKVIVILNK
jgi:hypothetical protein